MKLFWIHYSVKKNLNLLSITFFSNPWSLRETASRSVFAHLNVSQHALAVGKNYFSLDLNRQKVMCTRISSFDKWLSVKHFFNSNTNFVCIVVLHPKYFLIRPTTFFTFISLFSKIGNFDLASSRRSCFYFLYQWPVTFSQIFQWRRWLWIIKY